MKKIFLKFGLFLVLGLTTVAFYSCDKDDDDGKDNGNNPMTITATDVVNGSDKIATVRATDGGYVIAETAYQNNGFTLNFPETVDDKYLEAFWEEDEDEYLANITISDKTAKVLVVEDLVAFDKDDKEFGHLEYTNSEQITSSSGIYTGLWFYVDKDVTINGKAEESFEDSEEKDVIVFDNLNLKKGWNICYMRYDLTVDTSTTYTMTQTETYSMTKPSGVSLNWQFYEFFYAESVSPMKSMPTKSMLKSLFSKANR